MISTTLDGLWTIIIRQLESPQTADFYQPIVDRFLISIKMYASAHIITMQYRPKNKFGGLHDCFQTEVSWNYRRTRAHI